MTPLVVFDCNVVLPAAISNRGPAAGCLREVERGAAGLAVSDATRAEYQGVLARPDIRKKFPRITDAVVADLLTRIDKVAVRIDPVPAVVTLTRDPDDEKYLNLAVAAGAAYLVSRDNDLLNLMTGSDPDAVAFRTAHPGVSILDPVAFLQVIAPPPPTP